MKDQLDIEGAEPATERRRPLKKRADPSSFATDPIAETDAKALLTSVNVIRDPLHGDVRITRLERAILDTRAFQRLRHVNQLATVDLVYPGAVHTRFLHSIGTLHMCSELVAFCNNSATGRSA